MVLKEMTLNLYENLKEKTKGRIKNVKIINNFLITHIIFKLHLLSEQMNQDEVWRSNPFFVCLFSTTPFQKCLNLRIKVSHYVGGGDINGKEKKT